MDQFDKWNELKKSIEQEVDDPTKFPKEGEVWMCSLGKNIGFEQNGSGESFSRPVMIVKKFNNHMFWTIALSTKQKRFDFYFNYIDPNGLKVAGILAQMKLTSQKRLKRKLYEMPTGEFEKVKVKLKGFL